MPRKSREVRGLVVNWPARNDAEIEMLQAQHDLLNFAARAAGFRNYQDLTKFMWTRIATKCAEQIDAYEVVDSEIRSFAARFESAFQRLAKKDAKRKS